MATHVSADGRNLDLDTALNEVTAQYVANNPKSAAQFARACESLPGGNTRTGMFYTPFPLAVEKADGARIWDLDGHRLTDFVGDFSAGLYGHSHPVIVEAIRTALGQGMAFGSTSPYEERLASLVCARFPSIERVRFCNSGTEANIMALVTARAVTGRDAVMVFEGGYHGGTLCFDGEGEAINVPFPIVVAPYNDPEATLTLIEQNAARLAAVLVEPMQGAMGSIPGERTFFQALREACTKHGVVLIYDEVMTSRLGPNGQQGALGVLPDMTTLGKYVGGGMTFGAFGGTAEIMDHYDPRRPDAIVHHGTFNNNVIMLTAGAAGLEKVLTPDVLTGLNESGERLRGRLNALGKKHGAAFQVTGVGSIMTMHFQTAPIRSGRDIEAHDARLRQVLHLDLIAKGYFTTRRGFLALSLALEEADHDGLVEAIDDFLGHYGGLLDAAG